MHIAIHTDKFPQEGEEIEVPVKCTNCNKVQIIHRMYFCPMTVTYGECCCGEHLDDQKGNYTELNLRSVGKRDEQIKSI